MIGTLASPLPYEDNSRGWFAGLELEFEPRHGRTVLARNRHTGPLRLQRLLYPEEQVCHAYILHPPGGVVGGDQLETRATVRPGASALITTPGATKFYRSDGRKAGQENCLHVERNGGMEWLPQETIVYPEANAEIVTRIDLEKGAGFMGWDILCMGLPACNQDFNSGFLKSSIRISREGHPLLEDRLRVTGTDDLNRPAGMRGFSVCASFMALGVAQEFLAPLRERLEPKSGSLRGATLMEDLLMVRYLGDSTFEAKELFQGLWTWLRPRLFGVNACPPGIWAT